jgi:stage V sporulation protein SpoVS
MKALFALCRAKRVKRRRPFTVTTSELISETVPNQPRNAEPTVEQDAGSRTQSTGRVQRHGSVLNISNNAPAGRQAGSLAAMLRLQQHAEVRLSGLVAISTSMRVLSLASAFLSSHRSIASFTFAPVSQAQHQARVAQLMNAQSTRYHRHQAAAQLVAGPHRNTAPPQRNTPQMMQPQLPLLTFNLHVWPRSAPDSSTAWATAGSLGAGRPQMLDFALDVHQQWSRMAYVSFDTALSVADNLYAQLHARASAAQRTDGHAAAGASEPPALLCAVYSSQALLIFIALSFLQQRLREENSTSMLVCSVLPPDAVHRVDGRRGFAIRVEMLPSSEVDTLLSRRHTLRKQQPGAGGQ